MRIRFERTGGFANIPLKLEVDSEQLPAARARRLESLVEESRFFDQPAQGTTTRPIPDDFLYEIAVEDAMRKHFIRTSDSAASNELKMLFDLLAQEALAALKKKAQKP